MDNYTSKGNRINSAEIIEYAKQTIDKIKDTYSGAAPGEYDIDIAKTMINSINILMNTAVKLEALAVLSQINTSDGGVLSTIVNTLRGVIQE